MSGTKNRPHKRRNIILLVLLALLCIGGVELLVCRFAAPELFQRLTAPVAGLMQRVSDFGEALHSNLQELLSRPGEDEMVNQLAGPPAIEEVPPAEESKVTEFVTRDGREYLTGGVVDLVYYNQGEEPWASQTFGNDPIRGYGCGPTAMAMLASSLTGEETDPGAMADWAYQQGTAPLAAVPICPLWRELRPPSDWKQRPMRRPPPMLWCSNWHPDTFLLR